MDERVNSRSSTRLVLLAEEAKQEDDRALVEFFSDST
jgi:hypothetical protein